MSFEHGFKMFNSDKARYREHLIYKIMLKLRILIPDDHYFSYKVTHFIESIPGCSDDYLFYVANLTRSPLSKYISDNFELPLDEIADADCYKDRDEKTCNPNDLPF